MSQMHLTITTPEETLYDAAVQSVTVDTEAGEVTILNKHIPLISVVKPGAIAIKTAANGADAKDEHFAIYGGFLNVHTEGDKTDVTIVADGAERAEELDEQMVKKAEEEARTAAERVEAVDSEEYARVAAQLERELAKLKVLRRKK